MTGLFYRGVRRIFNRIHLIVFHIFIFISLSLSQDVPAISGYVTTVDGKPINGISLYLESYDFVARLTTDKNGYYCAPLRIGSGGAWIRIYIPTIIGNFESATYGKSSKNSFSYFRPKMRAPFFVRKDTPVSINFLLIESAEVYKWGSTVPPVMDIGNVPMTTDMNNPHFNYDQISLNNTFGEDAVIEYTSDERNGDIDVYTTRFVSAVKMKNGAEYPGCSLTYHEYTIYADSFINDSRKKIIKALGKIYIDKGHGLLKIDHMMINYRGKKVVTSF